MSTTKRKAGDRWTVIAIQPNGEAWPFQIGYWEVMSWPYLSQAEKIAKDYQHPGGSSTLIVVVGGCSYRSARDYNNQRNRVGICGVNILFAKAKNWCETWPVRYCNIVARKERMTNVDGKTFELVPNTFEWKQFGYN